MNTPFFGNAVVEQIQLHEGSCVWAEKHYFNLMSSMRLSRMEIPKDFTLERFEQVVLGAKRTDNEVVSVWGFGGDAPDDLAGESIRFSAMPSLSVPQWVEVEPQRLGLYRDFYKESGIPSQLQSNNTLLERVARVFAKENDYDQVVLLNTDKYIAAACFANIFLVINDKIITPSLDAGAYKGVLRREVIAAMEEIDLEVEESAAISPFELQRAQEVFWIDIFGVSYAPQFRNNSLAHSIAQRTLATITNRFSQD